MTRKQGLAAHHSDGSWVEQDPTKARAEHSGYFPNTEDIAPDEMRVIILGSGMPNARKSQASASVLVELGNGDKFWMKTPFLVEHLDAAFFNRQFLQGFFYGPDPFGGPLAALDVVAGVKRATDDIDAVRAVLKGGQQGAHLELAGAHHPG